MNTLFAFYLWLMQFMGVPHAMVAPELIGAQVTNPHTLHAPAPPPEDQATVTGQRDVSGFISNGF